MRDAALVLVLVLVLVLEERRIRPPLRN